MGRKNSKKRKTKEKSSAAKVYKGTVDMTRSGVAYIIVENLDSDIMVRQQGLNTALHGDMVWVEITKGKEGVGRMQGEVIKVVTRKRKEFVGRIEMNKGFAFFIPEMDRPMPDIYIPQENIGEAKNNERVVVRLVEWESSDKRPVGEVVHVLNIENENDLAMKEILLDSGFPLQFSDEAMEVAARIPETITEDEISKRKDCRSILTFTIDPVDAKDFDDALSFRPLKNGNYEIGVHIADVSHYVETETELDKEAYERATSVYLPDRVNPMLPEHISNFLCSLRPKEDKLTFSAIFQLTPKGDVKQYWLGKTVIHSDHRFTYEDVQEMIEGKEGPHKEELLLLNEMAQRMRKQRFKNGAINFSSQEVRFKLDEKGKPIGILIKESKEAHQLIEEFMLLANRKVAEHLSKIKIHNKPLPVPYRIHDDPDEEKLVPFVAFAKKFGHKFDMSSPDKIAESFNQLLKDAHGKPEQHVLEQLGIRTMAKAKYTIENVGHYGLGFEHYCHFTSPIRRYPDVLIHRVLQQSLIEAIVVDKKMEEKCKHCSERERAAMESERAANKYKQVEYMKDYLGEEFEGVISGVAAFGFWVETIEHKCEGLVSLNSLLDFDTFHHDQTDYCLTGQRSGKKFRMGDKVMIKVVAANLTKRQLDYEWVVEEAKTKKSKTKNAK
ncbi:MAG: ribonuclease R [Bacteroidetes bacterium]|nr:MAG: ribonuclease R [Bacteroidota bacterium]